MLQLIYQFHEHFPKAPCKPQSDRKRKSDELDGNSDDEITENMSASSDNASAHNSESDEDEELESSTQLVLYNPELAMQVSTSVAQVDSFLKQNDKRDFQNAKSQGQIWVGYVYAAETKCLKTLFKIGCTTRPVDLRIKELSRASVPEPFTLVACVPTSDPFGLEKKIHKHFEQARVNGKSTEFFKLKRTTILAYFHQLNVQVFWKETFQPSTVSRPQSPEQDQESKPRQNSMEFVFFSAVVNTLIREGKGSVPCSVWSPDLMNAYKLFFSFLVENRPSGNEELDLVMTKQDNGSLLHSTAFGKIWKTTFKTVLSHKILHGHKVHIFIPDDAKRVLLLSHNSYYATVFLSLPLKLK
jgi:hypothetical protein